MMLARWFLMIFFTAGVAHARFERDVTLGQMSPAARSTMRRQARGGRIMRIQRGYSRGRWRYRASVQYPGHRRTRRIEVDQNGNLLRIR